MVTAGVLVAVLVVMRATAPGSPEATAPPDPAPDPVTVPTWGVFAGPSWVALNAVRQHSGLAPVPYDWELVHSAATLVRDAAGGDTPVPDPVRVLPGPGGWWAAVVAEADTIGDAVAAAAAATDHAAATMTPTVTGSATAGACTGTGRVVVAVVSTGPGVPERPVPPVQPPTPVAEPAGPCDTSVPGYLVVTSRGRVVAFGGAPAGTPPPWDPWGRVAAATVTGDGRLVLVGPTGVSTDGQVTGPITAPVVAAVPAPGSGWWAVSADGGVFSLSGARFHGSAPGGQLGSPVVDAFPWGGGYALVTTRGAVRWFGPTGTEPPPPPPAVPSSDAVVAAAAGDGGYWLVTTSGRILAAGGVPAVDPVTTSPAGGPVDAAPAGGTGLWVLTADGQIHARGSAPWRGDLNGMLTGEVPARLVAVPPAGPDR